MPTLTSWKENEKWTRDLKESGWRPSGYHGTVCRYRFHITSDGERALAASRWRKADLDDDAKGA